MANKKINELSVRTPSLSDLMLVGDPSTGYSYKATISSLSTLLEANIALNDLSDVVITSVANGNLLAYNGTNWVNRTLGAYLGGTITQYVRGDGSLGDFSGGGGGGGSSVSYYLNGSVNQGTFGGTTYYEMNKTAIIGAGTDFTINANGYIASFITDAGDPALLKIPGGNWNLELYFSASSAGGTPSFYVELYKYDGTTFTLIASNSGTPEGITNGTTIDAYFTSISVPETVLTLTDRLAIRVYVTHSGRTITLHTENSHLCQIITTFTTGLTALNNLTAQVQYLVTGTSGTDFAISSTTATHTFNLPTASGSNRGALSSADWTTFNGKVGGSGTTNYVSKFTASGTIGNSQIFDDGTNVGIGTASPSNELHVVTGNVDGIRVESSASGYLETGKTGGGRYRWANDYTGANMLELQYGAAGATPTTTRMSVFSNGNINVGTNIDQGYGFYVNGTTLIGGTELRLNNGTTGVINLYSNTPEIRFASADPTNYRFYRSGTTMYWNSAGNIRLQIGGNEAYQIDAANGHILRSAISGGAALARLTTGGNLIVGGTTDAGYKLQVSGTARVRESLFMLRSDAAATVEALRYGTANTVDIGTTFRVIGTNQWNNTTSSTSYIQNGYSTKTFVTTNAANGSFSSYDFSSSNAYQPTIASLYTQKLINGAMTINSTAATNTFHGVSISATDNSSSIANNVYAIYADATLGTNTSANRWAGYFVGRGYFSQVLAIGTTSPNASAVLEATSTTKGFLPPRMTGAQAEAIGTPAAGLLVYSTDGSGATITSLGWWGYNGTTWVKLN